jgi:hypothetical protein
MRMTGSAFLEGRLASVVAADGSGLASGGNCRVRLAKAPFVPSVNSVPGDFTEADFGGYAARTPAAGAASVRFDTDRSKNVIIVRLYSGANTGWTWSPTTTVNLPQTIYGAYVQSTVGGLDILMSIALPNPVVLRSVNDLVSIDRVWAEFLPGVFT